MAPRGGMQACSCQGTSAGVLRPLAAKQIYHQVSAQDVALHMQGLRKGAEENMRPQPRSTQNCSGYIHSTSLF